MDLQHQKLAWTLHMVRQIIGADAHVDPTELEFLRDRFPVELLTDCGFGDPNDPSTRYLEARDTAQVELADRLPLGEKLQLLEILVDAAAADGVLQAEEADALHAAAHMLGVDDSAWREHLEQLLASGSITRDDCGV
jgi:uncharacterized tellurite resistance protein B-like protein